VVSMKMVCVRPVAITTGLTLAIGFAMPRDERHDTPDQPHTPHGENAPAEATTLVEWGFSGTNTSAQIVSTSLSPVGLVLPFESDPFVVTRLEQAGMIVEVQAPPGAA
jgi:hypothetical protein